MAIIRQRFDLTSKTGGKTGDTGPELYGKVHSIRYVKDTGAPMDTGATVLVEALWRRAPQTAVAFNILSSAELSKLNSGGSWTAYPNDTGSGDARKIALAGEALHAQVIGDSGDGTHMASIAVYIETE